VTRDDLAELAMLCARAHDLASALLPVLEELEAKADAARNWRQVRDEDIADTIEAIGRMTATQARLLGQ
jgi:hypothetical protein